MGYQTRQHPTVFCTWVGSRYKNFVHARNNRKQILLLIPGCFSGKNSGIRRDARRILFVMVKFAYCSTLLYLFYAYHCWKSFSFYFYNPNECKQFQPFHSKLSSVFKSFIIQFLFIRHVLGSEHMHCEIKNHHGNRFHGF
jgi:hypothetical protein